MIIIEGGGFWSHISFEINCNTNDQSSNPSKVYILNLEPCFMGRLVRCTFPAGYLYSCKICDTDSITVEGFLNFDNISGMFLKICWGKQITLLILEEIFFINLIYK